MDKQLLDKLIDDEYEIFQGKIVEKLNISGFPTDIKEEILDMEEKLLIAFMEKPVPLTVNEYDELCYKDENGDEIVIEPRTNDKEVFSKTLDDVTELLPPCPFDVVCGGNVRKQKEAIAAYKVAIANNFCNNVYKENINDVIKGYDFDTFRNSSGKTFVDVLELIQQDSNPSLKLIFTCASLIVTNARQKNEPAYTGIVSEQDKEALSVIEKFVALTENECNDTIRKLDSRIERLNCISKKDLTIEKYIKSKGIKLKTLYSITRLNSSDLKQKDVSSIKQLARKLGLKRVKSGELDSDYYERFVGRLYKKAFRRMVRALQIKKFKQYTETDDFDNILNPS